MRRPGLLVLADDLTGACECALAAVEAGGRAIATLGRAPDGDWDLVAIDLAARDGTGDVSLDVGTEREAVLKIDSTLRGPVRGLVERFAAATGAETVVVAPAFPARGRVTRGGRQHLLGAPDPPIDIRARIGDNGHDVVVLDAVDDADLDRGVACSDAGGRRVAWVGSAGLVAALVRARLGAGPSPPPRVSRAPVLAVVGSTTAESAEQARALRARDDVEVQTTDGGIAAALEAGRHVLLHGGPPATLAAAVSGAERRVPVARLLLTGGATARAVCQALGIEALEVLGAAIDGAPLARELGSDRLVVTKAGRFGPPDALSAALDRLGGAAA